MNRLSNHLENRIKAFDDVYIEAKELLLSEGYKLDPDLIIDTQISLALQAGIVPPMWTGFCICDNCGCMPAGTLQENKPLLFLSFERRTKD